MDWQINPYSIPLVFGAGISALSAVLSYRHRRVAQSASGVILCALSAFWLLVYAIGMSSPTLDSKIFWDKVGYVSLMFMPMAFFGFALVYTGNRAIMRSGIMIPLSFVPAMGLLLAFTNEWHGLVWSASELKWHIDPTFTYVRHVYGPAFYIAMAYCYFLAAIGVFKLMKARWRARAVERLQITALLVACLIPCVTGVLDFCGLTEGLGLRLSVPGSAVGSLAVALALSVLRRRASVEAARLEAMDAMSDGLVITDHDLKIIDMNRAASVMSTDNVASKLGRSLGDIWPDLADAKRQCDENGLIEFRIKNGEASDLIYEVSCDVIEDADGRLLSNVFLFHDVTDDERVRAELARRYEEAYQKSETDSLTGLLNHGTIHKRLCYELKRARREGARLSLVLIDLDGFKLLNDTYGHPLGDRVLKEISAILTSTVRQTDIVGRYGGDEFAIILPSTGTRAAVDTCLRLKKALNEHTFVPQDGNVAIPLGMSMGIASYPDDARHVQELVGYADTNLYESKRRGGNTVTSGEHVVGEASDVGNFALLEGLVTAVDNKDHYTRQHSESVAEYALLLAHTLGISRETQGILRIAALLHDLGKIGVPDKILRKPGPLDETEQAVVQQHTVLGELIIKEVPNLPDVLSAVASHHERLDGTGYPRGLKGDEIPLLGRILAVADTYSAMTTDRPYRKALSHEQARKELLRSSGSQLDPQLVQAFLACMEGHNQDLQKAI